MASMFPYHIFALLLFTLLDVPIQVVAQSPIKTFDFYSKETCLANNNDLDNLSKSIDIFKELGLATFPDGKIKHSCASVIMDLVDWPRNGQGRFVTYLDTTPIEQGCQLFFYDVGPGQEEIDHSTCAQLYRTIGPASGCVKLEFGELFGFEYCCGTGCNLGVNQPNNEKRRSEAPGQPKDHAKRACDFVRSNPEAKTTYGDQVKVGGDINKCENTSGCEHEVEYTTSNSAKDTAGFNIGATGTILEAISIALGGEFSWERGSTTELSWKYKIGMANGQNGYATFRPLLRCLNGKVSGDCGGEGVQELPDDWYCIPAIVSGHPDGTWGTVITSN